MKIIRLFMNHRLFLFLLLTGFIYLYGCEKDKNVVPPPPLDIITEDTTGKFGELSVEILYRHGIRDEHISAAPSGTDIMVYASHNDFVDQIPLYKTYTYGPENTIYFGFLNADPLYEYYIEAFARIDFKDYYGSRRVIIQPGKHITSTIIMEKVVTTEPDPQ